jgi:hypothetical protein
MQSAQYPGYRSDFVVFIREFLTGHGLKGIINFMYPAEAVRVKKVALLILVASPYLEPGGEHFIFF